MMNFLFGLLAGGLMAGIVTIAAARHPGVQASLGLVPPVQAALAAPPSRPEPRCPAPMARGADPRDLSADQYFSRRRFWYVAPTQ